MPASLARFNIVDDDSFAVKENILFRIPGGYDGARANIFINGALGSTATLVKQVAHAGDTLVESTVFP